MEILRITGTIEWNSPVNGDLPKEYNSYYVVLNNGEHKIMTYDPQYPNHWIGDWGEHSNKTDEDVKMWTELLPTN